MLSLDSTANNKSHVISTQVLIKGTKIWNPIQNLLKPNLKKVGIPMPEILLFSRKYEILYYVWGFWLALLFVVVPRRMLSCGRSSFISPKTL